MKHIVYIVSLLILCGLFSNKASAQVLPLNNPVWTLGVVPQGAEDFSIVSHISQFKLSGDTIIEGYAYHTLYLAEYQGDAIDDPYYEPYGGLRIDGKKIYGIFFNPIQSDFLVFDFDANIGDTINHAYNALTIVKNIWETPFGRAFDVEYGHYDQYHSFSKIDSDVWIEGVGPIQGFFIYLKWQTGYYATVRKLWTLKVNNELYYPEEDPGVLYSNVRFPYGLYSTDLGSVQMYYVPFAEKLSIRADESSYPYFLEIMTTSGSVLATKRLETDTTIPLGDLPSGSYICVLSKDRKVVTSQKILR